MAVWLQVKVREREFGLRARLYLCSVCDAQHHYSCRAGCALYMVVQKLAHFFVRLHCIKY